MTMFKTLITSRDDKGRHAVNLFEIAYDKERLNSSQAQYLNERGGELQEGISRLIAGMLASDYFYSSEYIGPKPIENQIEEIAKIFSLNTAHALNYVSGGLPELPVGAEGWFAIPKIDAQGTEFGERYCQAVKVVVKKIAGSREFHNFRDSQITPNHLRVHAHTAHALDLIAENQPGDILVIAAQLGMKYKGFSVRRARKVFANNEFGLGSLAVSSIVLTHPERFVRWGDLGIDCAGDEFTQSVGGDFSDALDVSFDGDDFVFDSSGVGSGNPLYGSASGFVT